MNKIPSFLKPIFKKTEDLNVRISQIPKMDVAFQTMALSEYELLVATIHKLNDLVTMTNSYSELIDEILKWVVGDGIEVSVKSKLTEWYDDGTLETIINDTLFKTKADKDFVISELNDVTSLIQNEIEQVNTSISNLQTDISLDIKKINDNLKDTGSVLEFGADPTGVEDSLQAFRTAFETYKKVLIPNGKFLLNGELKILSTDVVNVVEGITRDTTWLMFTDGGFVVEKSVVKIRNFTIRRPDESNKVGSGLKLNSNHYFSASGLYVAFFDIGVDIGTAVRSNVKVELSDIISGTNNSYGFLISSVVGLSSERNNISIRDCYAVSNGSDYYNRSRLGTKGVGDGFNIGAVIGVSLYDCVAEYNTGSGIWLSNQKGVINGVSIIGTYFEGNRYAQMYVDNFPSIVMDNVNMMSSVFNEGQYGTASNAVRDRRIHIRNKLPVVTTTSKNRNLNFEEHNYVEQITRLSLYNPENLLPVYNNLAYVSNDDGTVIFNHEDEHVMTLNKDNQTVSLHEVRALIEKDIKYELSFQYRNITGVETPPIVALLIDEAGGRPLSFSQDTGSYMAEFATVKSTFTAGNFTKLTPVFQIYNAPAGSSIFIKKVVLKRVTV